MKPILATIALLLLLGCQSKPRAGNIIWVKIHHPYVIPCKPDLTCEYYPFMEPVNLGIGSISHVTQAQWEAAQGLYTWDLITKDSYEVVDWNGLTECFKCTDDNNDPIDCKAYLHEWQGRILDFEPSVGLIGDTFPPSGDAK